LKSKAVALADSTKFSLANFPLEVGLDEAPKNIKSHSDKS
jgi:hypothetical protein